MLLELIFLALVPLLTAAAAARDATHRLLRHHLLRQEYRVLPPEIRLQKRSVLDQPIIPLGLLHPLHLPLLLRLEERVLHRLICLRKLEGQVGQGRAIP
jgi:hypothetical protein